MKTLKIDLVSDVVCPWCYIGFMNFSRARNLLKDEIAFDLHWHPFQLNPNMGSEGQNLREHIGEKYGSTPEQSDRNRQHIVERGQSLGIEFNFNDESRIYNTLKAHCLLNLAQSKGIQTELELALFAAYFTEGKNVSDESVLLSIAIQVGIDPAEAREAMSSTTRANAVLQEEALWKDRGISGVPAFVVNERYLISGAQPIDDLRQSFIQIAG